MVSAKLLISNNTGGAATVDVGITEQTDVIQLMLRITTGAPDKLSWVLIPNGQFTTSIYVDVGGVTGTFTAGEPLTWTNLP
ncbi:MAG: hypothetical protein CM15mV22_0040 [Eurybiavirus sp.]|nr:MAG: hypothetical protein CM15mV22_0040 [Eurybiavirus sp.]